MVRPDTQDDTWSLSLDHTRTGTRYAIPQIFSAYSLNGTTLKTEGGEDFMLIGEKLWPNASDGCHRRIRTQRRRHLR